MTASTCTVLIIEDFSADRDLYRRCLLADSSYAYHFLEVGSATAGLEVCRTEAIDAILLDYLLPDGNGLEFLTALRAQSRGDVPPVVIVTGEGDETVAVRAIKLGAEDYLVKRSLTPERLCLTVRSAIENTRLRLQLQQSEDRFRVSIENMLDCFCICSAIRDGSGQIIDFRMDYMNAAALEANGMTAADIGQNLCELLPAHQETGLFEEYCQVVETGEPLVKESLIYSDRYGAQYLTRAFDIRASKLGDGFVACWRDVTARKQAELDRQHQLQRERIFNQITQQIRRSLNPNEMLNAAVSEVRQFLGCDRAFIYRFNPDFSGKIVVESVAADWSTAIDADVEDAYFLETWGEDYRQGRIQVIEDVYQAGLTECHLEMLTRFQIRANLVVPILQQENLWGLLVINQCARSRQWQPEEINLSKQLADQIGIAIHQAELHQQLQTELLERRKAEAHLRETQEFVQHRPLAGLIPQLVWIADSSGTLLDVNERWLEYTGFTPEQARSGKWQKIVHPEDFPHLSKFWMAAQHSATYYQAEGRMRRADGSYRWHLHQVVPLKNEQGQIVRWFGTATDIHDLKQIEAERTQLLQQAETARAEAEAANHSKDEFIALVAHELRSPLNAVLGWAKLLQMGQLDAATVTRALETIERNTQSQVQLVEDLLDVSRIVRGTLNITLTPVNLNEVIEAAIETVRPSAVAKQLDLSLEIGTVKPNSLSEPLIVSGDFHRLQQIILNLLTNAIKFTPEGGRVDVLLSIEFGSTDTDSINFDTNLMKSSANSQANASEDNLENRSIDQSTNIDLDAENFSTTTQRVVKIQIRDTGIGISPEFLPQVFQRFQQDSKMTRTREGLGLGLAIVKHLVEMHGGRITAESLGVGQGATFTVSLPLMNNVQLPQNDVTIELQTAISDTPLAGIRILVVDDEPDMLDLTTFILEEQGAIIQTATNATIAFNLLSSFRPQILISDLAMPEVDGFDLLRQMRSLYPEGQIPAIALTAHASQSHQEQALWAGFQQHLTKPVEPERLVATILRLVKLT